MTPDLAWIWLALVVLLGTAGQLALKYALHHDRKVTGVALLLSAGMLAWIVCYAASTLLWLIALRSIPLSQAFPILGVQFALIPIAAWRFLREEVSPAQWAGIAIVVVGVALVGRS
jgi:undecaprenyl phosphate-alpha-L-ara4N flippase subunit ArnE